jgi:hypothetical protein
MADQGVVASAAKQVVEDYDTALNEVFATLNNIGDIATIVAQTVRKSIDDVIDSERTGRWSVIQLEKTEKTYIGTRVEIGLVDRLRLSRGTKLDTTITGCEVDIKFSLSDSWMIPSEAVNQVCLLVSADDEKGHYSFGAFRATPASLCPGTNKDGKKAISATGKQRIKWVTRKGFLSKNPLAELDADVRTAILSRPKGQQRINELFRRVKNRPISRRLLCALAQQDDPMKRVRDAKKQLSKEGIVVVCGRYKEERGKGATECMSFDVK